MLPLWKHARGEALPTEELDRFRRFCDTFHHRALTLAEKVAHGHQWAALFASVRSRPLHSCSTQVL